MEVFDGSPVVPAAGNAPDDAEGGRGLALVDALADRWGVATGDGDGKAVWFELAG